MMNKQIIDKKKNYESKRNKDNNKKNYHKMKNILDNMIQRILQGMFKRKTMNT